MLKAQSDGVRIGIGVGCIFCDLLYEERQWPRALLEARKHKARADDHALAGTIASPYYHEEPSSWRLQTYQGCTAQAICIVARRPWTVSVARIVIVHHIVTRALHRSARRRPCSMADGVLEKHSIVDGLLAVLGRTTDGVFALDQAARMVFWNAAAERITGYQADEVLGRPCYEIFGGEQRAGCHKCQPDCPVIRAALN